MTRTKAWRLSLAAILGFGWLFLTPAYSDDPLDLAAQQISELKSKTSNLIYKDVFVSYIDTAEQKYNIAVEAKNSLSTASYSYDQYVQQQSTALQEKNVAQSSVDGQTVIVASALNNKNNAQDSLNIANINLTNAQNTFNALGSQGVSFQIYPLSRDWYGSAYIAQGAGLMCQGSLYSFDIYAGSGNICGLHDNIIGIFKATLTLPDEIDDVYFAGATDDGFKLYVDGVLETSQWQEQGTTWSPYTRHFDTSIDKTLELEAWWYNGGGPGNMHVGYGYNGIWTGVSPDYLSYGQAATQEEINSYDAAVLAQSIAQQNYNDKLFVYNQEVQTLQTLQTNLTTANQNLTIANQNLTNATTIKNNASQVYDQSIIDLNNAIQDAWIYYDKQLTVELQAAIAQALANQPQPTQEPTISLTPTPTPEPSTEQTIPIDSNPTPAPETTDKVTPAPSPTPELSVQPTPKPSPQLTDIPVSPKPEPSSNPSQVPDKTINTPVDAQTANLIADLTNSSTLTKLTPEQKLAVSEVLGIKPTEIAAVAELAKSNESIAKALEEFGDRANANLNAPLPYTLADATTEVAAENLLSDPIGALTSIDLQKVLNPSEWGKDMTDDQREKAQEVIVPVIIASNLVAAAMTRRI